MKKLLLSVAIGLGLFLSGCIEGPAGPAGKGNIVTYTGIVTEDMLPYNKFNSLTEIIIEGFDPDISTILCFVMKYTGHDWYNIKSAEGEEWNGTIANVGKGYIIATFYNVPANINELIKEGKISYKVVISYD